MIFLGQLVEPVETGLKCYSYYRRDVTYTVKITLTFSNFCIPRWICLNMKGNFLGNQNCRFTPCCWWSKIAKCFKLLVQRITRPVVEKGAYLVHSFKCNKALLLFFVPIFQNRPKKTEKSITIERLVCLSSMIPA